MIARLRSGFFVFMLPALGFWIGCGAATDTTAPVWTVENPGAPQRTAQTPSSGTPGDSSLDSLRSGRNTATTPSSPLKDAKFAYDRYDLSTETRAALKGNAEWLKAHPSPRVQIEGHCDERGAEDYNMALGAKRAQSALDYLASLGIPANRLSTVSYGEEVPSCKEHAESCWEKNRRARFVLVAGRPAS